MNDHASVVRISRHEPAAGKRDEVAGLLKAVAESMRDAPGCFGAQVMSSNRDGDQLILVGRWESNDTMEKYNGEAEFTGFQREIKDSLKGAPDVEVLTTA
jgi:quinol monooxygenase YgiN